MAGGLVDRAVRFDVVSLFPGLFDSVLDYGVSARALDRGIIGFRTWNPREYSADAYQSIDDRPYGGGPGMVMLAEPLEAALAAVRADLAREGLHPHVIYFSPRGGRLDQEKVLALAQKPALTLVCGRYEGVDERFLRQSVTEEISLGDFVLSGGEVAALALMDAVIRQLPGVLGNAASALEESFADGLLDGPCFTRPEVWRGVAVPEVLRSGDHAAIARWRLKMSLGTTWERRPDLLVRRGMSPAEQELLDEYRRERGLGDKAI